jgi:hypothetical protein
MLGWVARFVACCGRPAFQRSLAALQLAAADAGPAFDRLAERGVEFELHDDALLYPAFDRRELEHLHRVVAELRATGARHPFDRVSAGRLVDLEPALDSDVARRLVGGLIAHGERRVRPESLVAGVHSAVRSRRVEVLEHSPATALRRVGPRWLVGCTRSGDAADDPLMIYNNPEASGTDLRPDVLAEIAQAIPGIVAFKECSGDARRIAELVHICPDVAVMVGGDDWALEGFCAGARAGSRAWPTSCPPSAFACGICARPGTYSRHASCTQSSCPSPAST